MAWHCPFVKTRPDLVIGAVAVLKMGIRTAMEHFFARFARGQNTGGERFDRLRASADGGPVASRVVPARYWAF